MMSVIVIIYLLLPILVVFGQNNTTDFKEVYNETVVAYSSRDDRTEKLKEIHFLESNSFLDDMVDWASLATDYVKKKSEVLPSLQAYKNGRKLKYKKPELKFIMKTFLILKVILGLILPLGIISSKILSWKAVTLSLMAFMLAKILFIKNLLAGKNAFSVTPTNFIPPYLISGGPNDGFWKRQGETQNAFI